MTIEERLKELKIELPAPYQPAEGMNYLPWVRQGDLIFLAGHIPRREGKELCRGRLGADLTVEEGYQAARVTGLNLLATLKGAVGSLDRVKRIVKVLGMVACSEDFTEQPAVVNGASDLLVEVFGEKGRHARSAVGVYALPLGIPVEIEMIVEVE